MRDEVTQISRDDEREGVLQDQEQYHVEDQHHGQGTCGDAALVENADRT